MVDESIEWIEKGFQNRSGSKKQKKHSFKYLQIILMKRITVFCVGKRWDSYGASNIASKL
jgi:hypothetical protein